jgi:predicted GNAT family acetyltransferase
VTERSTAKAPADSKLDLDRLIFRPVTEKTWSDFAALFESTGAPKHCWCMVWRRTSAEAKLQAGADRKRMMKRRIDHGTPVGLLAYSGKEPVAWCSIAPRETYRNLGGPEVNEGERIWSLACFYVPCRLRGQGLMRRLIAAAVGHAKKNKATIVEAYPVDEDSPSFRFMGFVPVFAEAGFTEIARTGTRRHVMRLEV